MEWNNSILSTLFNEYNSRLNLGVIKRSAGVPALGIIFDNYNENDEFWFLNTVDIFLKSFEPKLESQIGLEFKNNRYVPKYEDKSQKISNKLKSDFTKKSRRNFMIFLKKIRTTKALF